MLDTVFAKVFWHSRNYPEEYWNVSLVGVERKQDPGIVYEYPIIQRIPLGRILPDNSGDHNDIQRHLGIGHAVDRTYEEVLAGFDLEHFNLNKEDFLERWSPEDMKGNSLSRQDRLFADRDADQTTWLQV